MIIGRKHEIHQLNRVLASNEAELVVVYGRRRIGKTYLVREYFEKKKCIFVHVTGIHQGKLNEQIQRFLESVSKCFFDGAPLQATTWESVFQLLNQQILKHKTKKVVLFLDELPWLVTPRSKLLQIIDYYWNHHWSKLKNVILILCGSSASWLIKNIIYNKGGLHNRVTCELRLLPFNLAETKTYLEHRKIRLTPRHILSLYMALGGIPYYLKYIEPGLTAEENIQKILFSKSAPLKDEFKKLFQSLFEYSEAYIEIITILAMNKSGISRAELQSKASLSSNGGRLTERLRDLCEAGFIEEKLAWGKKQGEYYKLIDEFSLFHLNWIQPYKTRRFMPNHWHKQSQAPAYKSWAGYAFESVCMKHIDAILAALNIETGGSIDSWRFVPRKQEEEGAQIDLLIDRTDDAIMLCEIKFTQEPFILSKSEEAKLHKKMMIFKKQTKTKKQLFWVFISAAGLKQNGYSKDSINHVITLEDLLVHSE